MAEQAQTGMPARDSAGRAALAVVLAPFVAIGFVVAAATAIVLGDVGGGHGEVLRSPGVLLAGLTVGPVALAAFVLATVRWPRLPVSLLLFFCIFFNDAIESLSISTGLFQVYPQDVLLGLALVAALFRPGSETAPRWPSTALGKWVVVAILLGGLQALRGLALGNDFDAAFGDFRRGYFYMIVFFLVLTETSDKAGLRWVHRTFLLASLAIVGRGLYRLFFGGLYQMSWFDVFHVLSHGDLVFVIFLAYYCFARIVFPSLGRRRGPWVVLLPICAVLIVLGNFRASWIGFVLSGFVMLALLPGRKRRLLVAAAVPLVLAVAFGFYAMRNVRIGEYGETVQEEVVSKFLGLVEWQTDPNIIWRVHSYRAALEIWSEHPLLGAGLGRRLVFHSINAAGDQAIHYHHRAHNSLLWVGFTTGVLGLLVFLSLHGTYFVGTIGRLRKVGDRPEAGIILAYFGFYVAFMVTALFDVILENSATAIAMYAHMAIVWRMGDYARREN